MIKTKRNGSKLMDCFKECGGKSSAPLSKGIGTTLCLLKGEKPDYNNDVNTNVSPLV